MTHWLTLLFFDTLPILTPINCQYEQEWVLENQRLEPEDLSQRWSLLCLRRRCKFARSGSWGLETFKLKVTCTTPWQECDVVSELRHPQQLSTCCPTQWVSLLITFDFFFFENLLNLDTSCRDLWLNLKQAEQVVNELLKNSMVIGPFCFFLMVLPRTPQGDRASSN